MTITDDNYAPQPSPHRSLPDSKLEAPGRQPPNHLRWPPSPGRASCRSHDALDHHKTSWHLGPSLIVMTLAGVVAPSLSDDQQFLRVSDGQLEELGPIDYVVLEWQGELPATGEVQPLLVELVDRGVVRILDIAFVTKGPDGSVAAAFAEFEGASSGLLGFEDLQEAAAALAPGTAAAVLVWENRWAAPVAVALCRSGGQLVASGRLPVQAVLAALDAVEAAE